MGKKSTQESKSKYAAQFAITTANKKRKADKREAKLEKRRLKREANE